MGWCGRVGRGSVLAATWLVPAAACVPGCLPARRVLPSSCLSTAPVTLPSPHSQENIYRNFGMPQPNGYRKALRFMRHADKFGFPIVTFVDTPGAYAGKNAEELGQVRRLGGCLGWCLGGWV